MDDDEIGEEEHDCSEFLWLTTYGDAMTLLLVFFVLLLSMSTIEPETFNLVISSFQGAIGVFEGGRTIVPAELMDAGINVHEMSEAETTVSEQIPRKVENLMQSKIESATIRQDERGLVIQVTDRLLFEPGQIELTREGKAFLMRLSRLLKHPSLQARQLRVEGHTDDVDPAEFESNWEISVLRASRVVEQFVQQNGIEPSRLSAVGFGATRPIASNDTEEGRAKNRRVEIVILRDDIENEN